MTILDAHGLISGKKDMMYCVITRLELMELRRIVEKYDGSAFITVSDISEIIGDHIKKTSKVQQEVIAQQMEQREKAIAESEEEGEKQRQHRTKKHAVSNENCVLFDFQMLLGKRKSVSIMRGEDSGVYRQ